MAALSGSPGTTPLGDGVMLFRALPAVSLMLLAAPSAALACAVCGTSGPTDNSWAYFAMTMVLSGLPLCMIGGVVFWVYRRGSTDEPPTV